MNITTCLTSEANFTCAIGEAQKIYWLINGQEPLGYHITNPMTAVNRSSSMPSALSSLILPGVYTFNGASVICLYSASSAVVYSIPAFLRVQGLKKKVLNIS